MNKCYKKHPLGPDDGQDDDVVAEISGDINTEGSDALTKRSEAIIYSGESAEAHGIRNPGLDHACDSDFWMTLCNAENIWTIKEFVPQPSYWNCMASCKEMHMKDEAEKAEKAKKEESEGGSLSRRSEAVEEMTTVLDAELANVATEAEAERGPCDVGTWANAWCGVKSSWHWHREKAFNECIDRCLREHSLDAMVTKRSESGTAGNNTALLTSEPASTTVSLTKRNDFPYNGQLGEANDDDNHHCNNTWVQVKCSAKSMWAFWSYKKHYFRCIAECVAERDGDNWTEEDAEGDGGEQVKL